MDVFGAEVPGLTPSEVLPTGCALHCWSYWPVGLDSTGRAHLFLLKQIEGEGC